MFSARAGRQQRALFTLNLHISKTSLLVIATPILLNSRHRKISQKQAVFTQEVSIENHFNWGLTRIV